MAALFWFIFSLHSDICINGAGIVSPIELIVHLSNWKVEEGERSIYCELYQRNGSRLDELDLCYPWLSPEKFLQSLESSLYSFRLWQKVHVIEDGVIYGDINITISDRDAAGTAAE